MPGLTVVGCASLRIRQHVQNLFGLRAVWHLELFVCAFGACLEYCKLVAVSRQTAGREALHVDRSQQ